ncbi:MAG: hypothetical protein C0404_15060 [Verrucomicrobia bacterium]|nr:hypothetical protein [Verrucomicrobiota bacterium]
MKNRFFSELAMEVVLTPEHWRIISSLFDPDVSPVHNKAHQVWMGSHIDRHPAREILLALKGEGVYGFRNKVYPCHPGAIFLFDAYEPHDNYYPPACRKMLHLWLHILERDVVARFLQIEDGRIEILQSRLVFSNDEAMRLLARTWTDLAGEPGLPAPFKRAKLIAALSPAFLRIAEHGFDKAPGKPAEAFQSQIIRSIQGHIVETAGRDVPLTEAARLAGYSKFHFLRMFKKETGQTFHEYVNLCRLKQVRLMLDNHETKAAIARTLGFSHSSALLRWMKSMKKDV